MVIGFTRTVEFGTEEYMKIASGKKDIIEFKRDGTDTFGGDMLIIREVRKNGLKGDEKKFEVIRDIYNRETDIYTAHIRPVEG